MRSYSILAAALGRAVRAAAADEFVVAGYLPEWRYEGANYATLATHLTHLILFSAEPTPDGELAGLERLPRPAVIKSAREATRARGCELLVCFGGNGRSSGFSAMVADPVARSVFVANVAKLVEKHKLDGVDYNWEYPGYDFRSGYDKGQLKKDYEGLATLLEATRVALGPDKTISVAYYPDGKQEIHLARAAHLSAHISAKGAGSVDWFHAMAYDQSGAHHSSMAFATDVVEQAKASPLPTKQVTLGLPFYGRLKGTGEWETYEDLLGRTEGAAAEGGPGDDAVASKMGRPGAVTYNSPATIEAKVLAAKAAGLGGVMIWEAGQDCRLVAVRQPQATQTHPRTCLKDSDSLLAAVSRARGLEGGRPEL